MNISGKLPMDTMITQTPSPAPSRIGEVLMRFLMLLLILILINPSVKFPMVIMSTLTQSQATSRTSMSSKIPGSLESLRTEKFLIELSIERRGEDIHTKRH